MRHHEVYLTLQLLGGQEGTHRGGHEAAYSKLSSKALRADPSPAAASLAPRPPSPPRSGALPCASSSHAPPAATGAKRSTATSNASHEVPVMSPATVHGSERGQRQSDASEGAMESAVARDDAQRWRALVAPPCGTAALPRARAGEPGRSRHAGRCAACGRARCWRGARPANAARARARVGRPCVRWRPPRRLRQSGRLRGRARRLRPGGCPAHGRGPPQLVAERVGGGTGARGVMAGAVGAPHRRHASWTRGRRAVRAAERARARGGVPRRRRRRARGGRIAQALAFAAARRRDGPDWEWRGARAAFMCLASMQRRLYERGAVRGAEPPPPGVLCTAVSEFGTRREKRFGSADELASAIVDQLSDAVQQQQGWQHGLQQREQPDKAGAPASASPRCGLRGRPCEGDNRRAARAPASAGRGHVRRVRPLPTR